MTRRGAACAIALALACPGPAAPARTTVAVLPFDNLSRDSGDAYLARDLTEEITNRLVRLERLTVTSATVMRRYRGSDDPRAVAQALRVAYLVSGSVRRDRDRLRISVELLRARDGVAPWTDVFDRRDTSLLDIQIQVAQSVAGAITGRLLPEEQQRLAARATRDRRAYDSFARGNYALSQRTTRSILRAIQEYDVAVRRDSSFAAALAYQASAYALLAGTYYDSAAVGLPRDSLLARARAQSARALRADSNSAEAIAVAAFAAPPERRRVMLERALRLNPHNTDIMMAYAEALDAAGDTADGTALMRRAADEDPTASVILVRLGLRQLHARRYAEAQRWFDSAVVFRPEAYFFYFDRSLAHLGTGDTAVIASDIAEIRRLGQPVAAASLELLLAAARRDSAAVRAGAAELAAVASGLNCFRNFDCVHAAAALAVAGDQESALALLERTAPRDGWILEVTDQAAFDGLRNHPRFRRAAGVDRQ